MNAQLVEYVNYECSFVNLLVNFLDHSVADSSIYVHCVYGEVRSEIQFKVDSRIKEIQLPFILLSHSIRRKVKENTEKKEKAQLLSFEQFYVRTSL